MAPLLSIIIPVYNIAPWLDRCITSIMLAIPESVELLLVLGISTDESDGKCAQWKQKDPRIILLRQNGTGLANARNCGLRHSQGKYILYIDGDDFIDSDHLRQLLERLSSMDNNIQVVMTDYRMTDMFGRKIADVKQIGPSVGFSDSQTLMAHVLRKKKCFWNVWRYLYRRDFLIDNNIYFTENTLAEDMEYTAKVFAAQPRFAFAHCPFYQYCVGRGNSLMDHATIKRLHDTITNIQQSVFYMMKCSAPYSTAFIAQYQFEYFLNIALCEEIPRSDRPEAYRLYTDTMDILDIGRDPLIRVLYHVAKRYPIHFVSSGLYRLKLFRRAIRGNHRPGVIEEGD